MPASSSTCRISMIQAPMASGLYRTELQFMLATRFPRLAQQVRHYSQIIEQAQGKPVTFRTLDIGADKVLPYLRQPKEENPALGWRSIRMALDRPHS
jgi:phosphotransferase system, enzyme I, PtsP